MRSRNCRNRLGVDFMSNTAATILFGVQIVSLLIYAAAVIVLVLEVPGDDE